jgi:hypothetical protein
LNFFAPRSVLPPKPFVSSSSTVHPNAPAIHRFPLFCPIFALFLSQQSTSTRSR